MENSNKSKISIKIEGNTFDKNSIKIIAEFSDFPDTPIEALPFDYICALKNVLTYSSGIATKLLNAKMDYDSELSKEIDWITDEQYDSQSCRYCEFHTICRKREVLYYDLDEILDNDNGGSCYERS